MSLEYKLDHKYRGTALIIGNEFKGQTGERKGCLQDIDMACQLFKRLDFNVTVFKNLTAAQMKEKMAKASKNTNNKDSDCFVLVISTHGHEVRMVDRNLPPEADVWRHGVLGEDSVIVFVDEIMDIFNDKNSYELKGKPKLFFIQACKSRSPFGNVLSPGDSYDVGVEVNVIEESENMASRESMWQARIDSADKLYAVDLTDAEDVNIEWEKDKDALSCEEVNVSASQATEQDASGELIETDILVSGDSGDMPKSPFDIVPINCPDDFLIMYPVMSGKFAFRNASTGSYLIKFLYENLTELRNGCNLFQYLTQVCHHIATYEYNPDLANISVINRKKENEARLRGESFDPLAQFRKHLNGTLRYLSSDGNNEKLVSIIGEQHRDRLKADPTVVEPYLRDVIKTLTEKQMTDILNTILPFKMTACVVHRLAGDVYFKPKKDNSYMGIIWKLSVPTPTNV